jgi:hypothetical protein
MPRLPNVPPTTGSSPPSGQPNMSTLSAFAKAFSSGGSGKGSRGIRGPEIPSAAMSAAISRRLNGNPPKGTELKGL